MHSPSNSITSISSKMSYRFFLAPCLCQTLGEVGRQLCLDSVKRSHKAEHFWPAGHIGVNMISLSPQWFHMDIDLDIWQGWGSPLLKSVKMRSNYLVLLLWSFQRKETELLPVLQPCQQHLWSMYSKSLKDQAFISRGNWPLSIAQRRPFKLLPFQCCGSIWSTRGLLELTCH